MIFKRMVAVGIGLLMMLQTTVVFAGTFNDLKDSEWAEPYIEKMASKSIITGFNGQYKPVDPVNKYSAVVMIYRTLKAAGKLDETAVNASVAKYASVLSANKVPAWPDLHQGVAWMLENGVIQQEELKYFMSGENHINARRYELSIFLGKALNVFLKENVNTFISLNFKDANLISSGSAPYVNLLVNKKILNGDLEGNFKPYDPMTRAAMAKVLSVSYDLIGGTGVVAPTTPTTPTVPVPTNLTTKTGTLSFILEDTKKIIVTDSADTSKNDVYSVEGVTIQISGVKADLDDLDKGSEVKLSFDGAKLVKVESGSYFGEVKGVLKEVEKMTASYRIVITEDVSGDKKTYYTDKLLSTVKVGGVVTAIDKLKAGDKLTLRFNDQKQINAMTVTSRYQTYEGILKSQLSFVGKPQITIKLDGTQEVTLELDTEVDIERNDDDAEITDLVVGDFVTVRTSYDKVDRIYSFSAAKKDVEGTIQQIVIGKVNKITVLTEEDGEKEYTLSSAVAIEVDNDDADVYGLRVGYEVELEVEGTVATTIDASKSTSNDQLSGTISKLYDDLSIITLKQTVNGSVKYTSVSYNSSTKVLMADGTARKISNLDEGDTIFVYGAYRDTFFLAEKIIVLE